MAPGSQRQAGIAARVQTVGAESENKHSPIGEIYSYCRCDDASPGIRKPPGSIVGQTVTRPEPRSLTLSLMTVSDSSEDGLSSGLLSDGKKPMAETARWPGPCSGVRLPRTGKSVREEPYGELGLGRWRGGSR